MTRIVTTHYSPRRRSERRSRWQCRRSSPRKEAATCLGRRKRRRRSYRSRRSCRAPIQAPREAARASAPANNDQKLVQLANEALLHEHWGIEYGERGDALAHLSARIFPGRYGHNDSENGWEQWRAYHETEEEKAVAKMTMTPAASVAGLAVKLQLLERDTESWHTAENMIALFRSALDDAERLARGGAS
jgi:hypothetical protein